MGHQRTAREITRFDRSGRPATLERVMNPKRSLMGATARYLLAMLCTVSMVHGTLANMQSTGSAQASSSGNQAAKIPPEQLDSLVAPIALYPDPMLAQTLAACTY